MTACGRSSAQRVVKTSFIASRMALSVESLFGRLVARSSRGAGRRTASDYSKRDVAVSEQADRAPTQVPRRATRGPGRARDNPSWWPVC
jgi:hypothetical protein